MTPLIAGNWKMNGLRAESAERAQRVARAAAGVAAELWLCPPFTAIGAIEPVLRGTRVGLGAQDCHARGNGAHTGDISAPMLADAGCGAVILGHSERRAEHGETDAQVRAKTEAAMAAGLMPIVCVGESEAERLAGHAVHVVCGQVAASLPDGFSGVVAYEPIWAIGTGRTPTEADVAEMHAAVRAALRDRLGEAAGNAVRILYGGSVKPENARVLLRIPEVGGALVGGASLDPDSFLAIAEGASGK